MIRTARLGDGLTTRCTRRRLVQSCAGAGDREPLGCIKATMPDERPWRAFEREVHAELSRLHEGALIRHDARILGVRSGVARQIDVLVDETVGGSLVRTAVDAKRRKRKIDVKEVEGFIGLLRDTCVNRGIMVSASGYTAAALARAFREDVDLDLDVFSIDEFKQWQRDAAIPYAGRNAVWLPAPLGWAVDGQRREGVLATLYRRGLAFADAARQQEFMYANLWDRRPPVDSLDALLADQEANIRSHAPSAVITLRDVPTRLGFRACVRRADIPSYPTAEITGFVEFPASIVFLVLFTPPVVERRNVRQLEYLLQKVMPISVRQNAA